MSKRKTKQFLHREMTRAERVIGTLLVVLFSVFLYLSSPLSRINAIYIHVDDDITSEQVLSKTELVSNELFFIPIFFPDYLTQKVKQCYPKVEKIDYTLDSQNNLTLTVHEYNVVATVLINQKGYVILSNGAVLENYYAKYHGSVTDITWEDSLENLSLFAQEFVKIDSPVQKQIASITHNNKNHLLADFFMSDGNKVIINYTEFAMKMMYYPQLVKEVSNQKGVFDFSIGIFFTPYK